MKKNNNKTETLYIRVTPELKAKLEVIPNYSKVVRMLLNRYLNRNHKTK